MVAWLSRVGTAHWPSPFFRRGCVSTSQHQVRPWERPDLHALNPRSVGSAVMCLSACFFWGAFVRFNWCEHGAATTKCTVGCGSTQQLELEAAFRCPRSRKGTNVGRWSQYRLGSANRRHVELALCSSRSSIVVLRVGGRAAWRGNDGLGEHLACLKAYA